MGFPLQKLPQKGTRLPKPKEIAAVFPYTFGLRNQRKAEEWKGVTFSRVPGGGWTLKPKRKDKVLAVGPFLFWGAYRLYLQA